MTAQRIRRDSRLFFSGLLISSVGSMTFTVGLIVFMARAGYGLFQISLIVGLSRFIPVVVSVFLGDLADRLSPKQTVLATEILAGLSSVGILLSWGENGASYPVLLFLCAVRTVILAVQLGSRAKLVKQLSDSSYESNSRNAILFNKATQGATLFGGMLAWLAFRYVNFQAVVILDATTFLLNGIFLLGLSQPEENGTPSPSSTSILRKFKDLYAFNPKAAILDALLALAIMGMASFNTRLAGAHQEWNAVLVISYGLAVWVAGWIERSGVARRLDASIWMSFGLMYACLGALPAGPVLVVASFVKDIFFWILFHRISTRIQMDTPHAIIGSVSNARNAQMVTILALGELAVGSWQGLVPIFWDGMWRGLLCAGVGLGLMIAAKPIFARYPHERPAV